MKKVKSNRYEQAVSEIQSLDKDQVSRLNEEIKFEDRNHYHVAMVKITDRPGEAKNDVSVVVQMFNEPGFKKIEKNFKFLGWSKIAIVHDPKLNKEEDLIETGTTTAPTQSMTPEEMEAEIERRSEEKANQKVKDLEEGGKKTESVETGDQGSQEATKAKNPFANGETIGAMKEFAEQNGIDLSGLKLQADIKNALEVWKNEQSEA